MRLYKILKTPALIIMFIISLLLCIMFIFYSKESFAGAYNGLQYSLNVLIPSLFPFMVISSFIIKSGVFMPIAKIFKLPAEKLFKISYMGMFAFVLSMIGGYPIGAKCVRDLYSENLISENETKKLIMYCVGAGPGFLITFVGANLLSDKKAGYILLLSQILTMFTLSLICRNMYKSVAQSKSHIKNKKSEINKNISTAEQNSFCSYSEALVISAEQASITSLNMCGLVVIFSAFTNIISSIFNNELADKIIFSIFEITNACNKLCGNSPLAFIGFLTGFGGLCVHFQIYKILSGIDYSKRLFFLFRILQGILNTLFTYIFLMIFPYTKNVFSTVEKIVVAEPKGGLFAGAILLLSCICFLLSLKKN